MTGQRRISGAHRAPFFSPVKRDAEDAQSHPHRPSADAWECPSPHDQTFTNHACKKG
jgi:hypothetical protein